MSEPLVVWASDDHEDAFRESSQDDLDGPLMVKPPHPINWNLLSAEDAEAEWIELNRWASWLGAYDPDQHGSAPIGRHRDFADARHRLRDWVAISGTRLEWDRPTRQTAWPGEPPADVVEDIVIGDRYEDFVQFVVEDVTHRREAEAAFCAPVHSG